jgi:hypothetical protein
VVGGISLHSAGHCGKRYKENAYKKQQSDRCHVEHGNPVFHENEAMNYCCYCLFFILARANPLLEVAGWLFLAIENGNIGVTVS